jgi:energy-coupling factor transporter ATP-binding protein EcfA2
VNIAIELITEPPLLFLDEPTSGLDATATLEVLTLLQSLAKEGRTILMTVHQPRVEAFRLMDMLLLLEKGGKLAYFGPAMPGASDYFERHAGPMPKGANPADYVLDVLESTKKLSNGEDCPPGTWQRLYRASEPHAAYVRSRLVDRQSVQIAPVGDGASTRGAPGMGRQLRSLIARLVRRKSRDRAALVLQLLQPLVVGGLLAAIFDGMERWPFVVAGGSGDDPCELPVVVQAQAAVKVHAVLFLVGATAFWLGCSNVARELVAERAVFRRERMAGLSVPAYAASVFTVQALVGAVQCLVLAGLIWGANLSLESGFGIGFGATLLTLVSGLSVGMVVSSVVRTEVTAISTLPLLLLPQLILAGYIEPYSGLNDTFRAMAALMPVRWAFDGLLRVEYFAAEPVCGVEKVFGFPDLAASPLWVLGGFSVLALAVTYARLVAIKTSSDT